MKQVSASGTRSAILACCGVATALASLPATAVGEEFPTGPVPSAPGAPANPSALPRGEAPAPSPPPALLVSPKQLEALAELFSAPADEVKQRLGLEPDLVPLALQAAQERRTRKNCGKPMAGIGWTLAGLGLTFLAVAAFDIDLVPSIDIGGCDYLCEQESHRLQQEERERSRIEMAEVGGIVTAIGLLAAIPGTILLVRAGETEKQAIGRYQQIDVGRPASPVAGSASLKSSGLAFQVPLLSFRF